jgi:SAM-dependent methyltransferase
MSTSATAQAEVDRRNSSFWNELCGTTLAQSLGISDFSAASLARFDRYYFQLYPYLDKYVRFEELRGKEVLEVGLGYGTVSQRIAACGARYSGLDIASGPVEVVNLRLGMLGVSGRARTGSILDAPFADASFDAVVTIGCLHHTGNLQQAIHEVYRVLRPGGRALVMVYNALSYRRWLKWPAATWRQWREGKLVASTKEQRAAYDSGTAGEAPETVFTSKSELTDMCIKFSRCDITKENAARERLFRFVPRPLLLPTVGPLLGLDLYATLIK